MSIIAIRHLITPWNREGLLQGKTDIEVDFEIEENQVLIENLKNQLAQYSFREVIVSPYKRAQATACALGYNDFISDHLVGEMGFGRFEGRPKLEMLKSMKGNWISAPFDTELGEELKDLSQRVVKFREKYSTSDSILLISHGAFIRALKTYIELGRIDAMNQLEVRNGELIIL